MSDRGNDGFDALETLAHEIRIDILRALAEADEALSFTELRERAGIRDTGKFNYHLTKLCEYFVRETDGGYELGHAGSRLIGAAGTGLGSAASETDAEATVSDGGVTEECPVCGEEDCEKLFHVHLRTPW